MPTHFQRTEAVAQAGDFIILYAGKPIALNTGDLLDESEAHKASRFADYTAGYQAAIRAELNLRHCIVTQLNKFQEANN